MILQPIENLVFLDHLVIILAWILQIKLQLNADKTLQTFNDVFADKTFQTLNNVFLLLLQNSLFLILQLYDLYFM